MQQDFFYVVNITLLLATFVPCAIWVQTPVRKVEAGRPGEVVVGCCAARRRAREASVTKGGLEL